MKKTAIIESNTDRLKPTVSGRLHKFVMPVFSKDDEVFVSLPGGEQKGKIFKVYEKYDWSGEVKHEVRGKNLVTITSARSMRKA